MRRLDDRLHSLLYDAQALEQPMRDLRLIWQRLHAAVADQMNMKTQAPKETKQKPDKSIDENGEPMNPFAEMLRVMDVEWLIRFRRRLEKVGRKRMVEILTEEIDIREAEGRE
jgi:hypothetical protein